MTNRRSPIERDARTHAARALKNSRAHTMTADESIRDAITSLEHQTTWAVQRNDIPSARRYARAVELLEDSRGRLVARRGRTVAAELAAIGLVNGVKVRDTRGAHAPIGLVLTIKDDMHSPYIFATAEDGTRHLVYAPNLELVTEPGIRESGIGNEPLEQIPCDSCGRDHIPDEDDPTQQDTCWECQNGMVSA